MRALQLVPGAVVLLTSLAAHAGVTLTYERKKAGEATSSGTATILVDGEHIRMEGMTAGQRSGRSSAMIFDAAGKKMIILDDEKKAYREMTEADAKQMKERMDGMRTQMAERMKNLPPEQRKMAEEAMGRMGGGGPGGEPAEVKYEPLGTKKKVAGFACEVYRVQAGSRSSSEGCFAPWGSNLVTKAETVQFKKLLEHLQKSFSFVPTVRRDDWSKAPGIPVEQTHFGADGKTPEWTNTLKSVTRGTIPAAQFQVPAGYKKEEMPMGGRGPRGGGPGGPGGPRGPGGPGGPQ